MSLIRTNPRENRILCEKLSYAQLFRVSDPKRVVRSYTVRGPALDIEVLEDSMYQFFNFKSFPSTTGRRQKGYIRFFKSKNPNKPLEQVECEVDCTCPDYKYRFAWVNKQRGSSKVGPGSINGAWNRAPRITNPRSKPGLCKHLLALRDYIQGQLATFKGEAPTSDKLTKLVKRIQKGQIPAANSAAIDARDEERREGKVPDLKAEVPKEPEKSEDTQKSWQSLNSIWKLGPQESVDNSMNISLDESIKMLEELEASQSGINTGGVIDPNAPKDEGEDRGQEALDALKSIKTVLSDLLNLQKSQKELLTKAIEIKKEEIPLEAPPKEEEEEKEETPKEESPEETEVPPINKKKFSPKEKIAKEEV